MKKITIKNKILILLSFVFIFIFSFAISTFAYHEDSNGNLVSDNLIDNSTNVFELGAVSYNIGRTYSENKVSSNARIRTINLISVDSSLTYSLSVPSPYLVIAQGYNNNIQVSASGTQFNQALSSLSFTGVSQVSIIVRKSNNSSFSSINDISNIDLMFNVGSVKSYESYGSIYFKERVVSSLGLLNYTNIKYGYFEHAYSFQYNTIYRSAFIYNGNYGHLYDNLDLFDWNDFELDSNNFIYNKIYSKYGSFYNTEWNAYSFITNYGSYSDNDNIPFTMNYELIAPISFTDVAFSFNDFELVYFYDSNGFLLKTITSNDNQLLSLTDVSKIVCYNHINDIVGDSNYIITDLYAGSYDIGYSNGYNNALSYANPIIDEYKQAIDTYKDTIHILSERISSLENSNRNYTNLIWTIGATPWESFKHIWNVEFGGINIANIITGLVTALLVIYLIKKIWK